MDALIVAGVLLVLLPLLALGLRALALWYWRVGEAIDALKSIDRRLSILVQIEVERRELAAQEQRPAA